MTQALIAGQLVDVPPSRCLRQPSYRHEGPEIWNEELVERAAAALAKELGNDVAEELIAALAMRVAATATVHRPSGTRRGPLQRFERRLRKSVDTFNRQFG